ncbi:hypothetical protein D9758_009060 [Tetrapyrgos nigripes]|uniref:Uncharacterized protein n=1 Tax=Tetrapyrgos nigripes TaxID=182062 RepID=A0A8H5LL68_9AGAR|nr:hypothetical protein D9758_009060 [Tetrapyrgos nigripes]
MTRPKPKQPAKGETLAEVERVKKTIRKECEDVLKGRKKGSKKHSSSDSGGILADWQKRGVHEHVDLALDTDEVGISIAHGGITDDDTIGDTPALAERLPAIHIANNLVNVSKMTATPKSKPFKTMLSNSAVKSDSKISSPAEIKTPSRAPKPMQSTSIVQKNTSTSSVGTDSPIPTSAVVAIPNINDGVWKKRGCDTFNALLFASTDPFGEFAKSSESFLLACQSAVPKLWNSEYKVVRGDAIFKLGYNKIIDKRSDIGQKAMAVVNDFFAQKEYANQPILIREYARWALHYNGPLLYAQPGAPNTDESAKGSWLSPHIINVIKTSLPCCEKSVIPVGIPVGLLGLAAAGLERAFCLYRTGYKATDTGFREDLVGQAVKAFVKMRLITSQKTAGTVYWMRAV